MASNSICPRCQGLGWTCEVHVLKPMDHDDCVAAGKPCELCSAAGELPELSLGFVPTFAIDVLLDQARALPEYTATGRLRPSPGNSRTSVVICPTCREAVDLNDITDVLRHAATKHERRRDEV